MPEVPPLRRNLTKTMKSIELKNFNNRELFADPIQGFRLIQETTQDGSRLAAKREREAKAKAEAEAAQRALWDRCTCNDDIEHTGPVPPYCPCCDGDYSSFLATNNCD